MVGLKKKNLQEKVSQMRLMEDAYMCPLRTKILKKLLLKKFNRHVSGQCLIYLKFPEVRTDNGECLEDEEEVEK